ncbi:MAG: WYL domain-containing protein, partial [Gammaproteobacteria bacterium]|nr:WYL domain-containing protein [Gammaproteobacteria bacterium]
RRVTELDYEMENGEKAIRVRGALFFYLARRLGLSKNSEVEPPKSQHIVPLNWNEATMKIAELKRSDKDALRNT